MSYYTISHWEADEWTDEMEAIAKDKFGPMIMAVGASSLFFGKGYIFLIKIKAKTA